MPPFVVTLEADEETGPAKMHYEGLLEEYKNGSGQQNRTEELAKEFLSTRPKESVRTGEILAHLESKGIPERTGQRVLEEMRISGRINRVKRGYWQIAEQENANQ